MQNSNEDKSQYHENQNKRYGIFYNWSLIVWAISILFILIVKYYFSNIIILNNLRIWATIFLAVGIPLIILFSFPLRWFDEWTDKKIKK